MVDLKIFSRIRASFFKPENNKTIAIRITDPEQEFFKSFNKNLYQDVLELKFHDSNPEYMFTPALKKLLFKQSDSFKIFDFMNKNLDAYSLVVHCDYGQSRSATIAKFIANTFFDDEGKKYWVSFIDERDNDMIYSLNDWVYKELEKDYRKQMMNKPN